MPGSAGPAQAAGVPLAGSGASTTPAFVARVAQLTGLDPKVVAAWVKAEGAYAPNGTGGYNFLNIRTSKSYSGVPLAGTTSRGFAQFFNANDAATETAHWINSMPNYRGIRQATKLGPRSQLAAIAGSPWDSGHYGGGKNLYNDYAAIQGGGGGINWGSILGGTTRVIGDITNPIGGAADVAGLIPGVSSIPGVGTGLKILTAPEKIAEETAAVIGFVFNPSNWLRIGYIIGGGVFVIGGLFILARSVGSSNAAEAVKDSAATVAQLTPAAPEARAYKQGHRQGRVASARSEGRKAGKASISKRERIETRPQPVYSTRAKSSSRSSQSNEVPF